MRAGIDHVVICVGDLDEASARFERQGFATVDGGRHLGQGTANRLIPLEGNYLELIAVVDPREAKTSGLGNWVTHRSARPGADAVCLRLGDFDHQTSRFGLSATEMERATPEGHLLRWRLAGLKDMLSTGLPFFIDWLVPDDQHPSAEPLVHPAGDVRISSVHLSCEDGRLLDWVQGAPEIVASRGPRGVEVVLESDQPIESLEDLGVRSLA